MRKLIFGFSLALIVLSALLTVLLLSRQPYFLSVVALSGSSEDDFVGQKILLESPAVVEEVSQKYFSVGSRKFLDGRMSVQLVTENGRIVPFAVLGIKARSAEQASQASNEIVANFIALSHEETADVFSDEEKALNSYVSAIEVQSAGISERISSSSSRMKKLSESGYKRRDIERLKGSIKSSVNVSDVVNELAEESARPVAGVEDQLQRQENVELLFAELENNVSSAKMAGLLGLRKELSTARLGLAGLEKELDAEENWIRVVSAPRLANPSDSVVRVAGGDASVAEAKTLMDGFKEYMPGRPFFVVSASGKTAEKAVYANENYLGSLVARARELHKEKIGLVKGRVELKKADVARIEEEVERAEENLFLPDDASSLKLLLSQCRSRLTEIRLERAPAVPAGMVKKSGERLSPESSAGSFFVVLLASLGVLLLFVSAPRNKAPVFMPPRFKCENARRNVVVGVTNINDLQEISGEGVNLFPDEGELAGIAEDRLISDIKRKTG